ncbi:hypothetical protein EGW08_017564, partial [Elysia chlorotica]
MPEDSVKVAVRVRPFNQREKDRNAKLVIKMQGSTTTISNPEAPSEEPKKFAFDYSYWSHDGFSTQDDGILVPEAGSPYASQHKVFQDLGQGVLDNAFEGYNCSLFAYGQTGSGKSYSMVGYGANKLVDGWMDGWVDGWMGGWMGGWRFEVTFSMLEIYNEQVRDLLAKDNPKGGLPVRQNPKLGMFYVQNLKKIEMRMEQGGLVVVVVVTVETPTGRQRHLGKLSSWTQTVETPTGRQRHLGKLSSWTQTVETPTGRQRHLGKLSSWTQTVETPTGRQRHLGKLSSWTQTALADQSENKKTVVPYRDSVLTKLLQNALGGNSKTVMIAALSPADINYVETLSTLRYADRAKKIKNQAVINENPLDKMIRELKEENEKLRKALEAGGLIPSDGRPQMS